MQSGAIVRVFFPGATGAALTAYGDEFHGLGFHFTDLEGWTDAPEVVTERVRRPASHGSFAFPAWVEERVVRIQGFQVSRTHHDLEHAAAGFRGLVSRPVRFVVEDVNGTTWAVGKVTAARFRNYGFAPEGTWALEVTCEDPRKYGEMRAFPDGATAVHYGNFPATPRLMIGAGSGGYTVTGPGGRVVTVNATAPTAAHYIDFADGGLFTAAGARVPRTITVYQPWEIPPGGPGVVATITGSRTLSQRVTDTFI